MTDLLRERRGGVHSVILDGCGKNGNTIMWMNYNEFTQKSLPKSRIELFLILSFLVLLFAIEQPVVFAGQASLGPAIAQNTQMVVNESSDAGEQKKEEFYRHLQSQLDEFDRKIVKLQSQGDVLREKARNELHERLEQLQSQKSELLPKIESATRSSEAAWEDIKGGLDRAVTDLKVALEQAASNFF